MLVLHGTLNPVLGVTSKITLLMRLHKPTCNILVATLLLVLHGKLNSVLDVPSK
jgi:hypothetical protein